MVLVPKERTCTKLTFDTKSITLVVIHPAASEKKCVREFGTSPILDFYRCTLQKRFICIILFITCVLSPGLRAQLAQWENSDYLHFPHQVHQPKSVEAKLSKPGGLKYYG